MASDYADDAVLERAGETYSGRDAIEAYFVTVPSRLGPGRVVFDSLDIDGDIATFSWHLEGLDDQISGTDRCRIVNGQIVHQRVTLDKTDF